MGILIGASERMDTAVDDAGLGGRWKELEWKKILQNPNIL